MKVEKRTRILIGAESFADAKTAIEIARILADALTADLGGLFVADAALTRLPRLPGRRVVSSGGRLLEVPTPRQLRAVFASDIQAFRQELAETARRTSVEWTFETQVGDFMETVAKAAAECDILLLGHRPSHRHLGDVLFVGRSDDPATEPFQLARTLAQALRTRLQHLTLLPQDTAPGARQDAAPVRHFKTSDALIAYVNQANAAAIVVEMTMAKAEELRQLNDLLRVARCPVAVTGAPRPQTATPRALASPTQGPAP